MMKLRKRTFINSIDDSNNNLKFKKRKGTCIFHSKLEDLPGEIWFDIFSYLDGETLIAAFFQLNCVIDSLLCDYRLPVHLNILSLTYQPPFHFYTSQITSISLDYSHVEKNQIINISQFIRLRSIRFININEQQLEKHSQHKFKDLYQISIRAKCARFILKMISIYFPYIHRIHLNSIDKEFVVKSIDCDKTKNQVEYLKLDGTIKLAKVFRLWSYVPKLRSFSILNGGIHQCDYWLDENAFGHQTFPVNLSQMYIRLCDDDMSFSNLKRLIPKTVRYLTITGSIADDEFDEYLSSSNWIRLMSNCSNQLQHIKLDISSYFDPSDPSGLQRALRRFRKNSFFRQTTIRSRHFLITIQGYIEPKNYE